MSTDISKYVEPLTVIGLEDNFLSSGKFCDLPPGKKIDIVTKIIDKKLELGRWENVVKIMYGDSEFFGQFYQGNKNKLENEIIKSSRQRSTYMKTEAIKTLQKAGKDNVIFELAFNIPNLHYGEFMNIVQDVDSNFFADPKKGEQRKQKLNQTAADLAMKEEQYKNAFHHFKEIGDNKNISNIFEIILEKKRLGYDDEGLLQKIALDNKEQKESRLKKIILKSAAGEFDPLKAFRLYQEHDIQLSNVEKENLQKRVVESARRHDITNTFSKNPEIQLLWAKRNARDEPKTAYQIFKEKGYSGEEVIKAVQTGLSLNYFSNKEKAMDTSEINEEHLKEAYSSAPLDTQIKIIRNLLAGAAVTEPESSPNYFKELKKLSRKAIKENKIELAYDLWFEGRGRPNCKYINKVRTALIQDRIENHYGIISLNSSDKRGKVEAYEALIKTDNLEKAYEIALELGGKRLDQIHEKMVSSNPRWATDVFTKKKDKKGLEYLTKNVASEYNISSKKLRNLINQYQTD